MILLPRSWRIGTVRSVVNGAAWLLLAAGLYGSYREACGASGWGSFIIIGLGVLVIALLAASEEGLTLQARVFRLTAGALALPMSVVFQAVFQDFIRFACPT